MTDDLVRTRSSIADIMVDLLSTLSYMNSIIYLNDFFISQNVDYFNASAGSKNSHPSDPINSNLLSLEQWGKEISSVCQYWR